MVPYQIIDVAPGVERLCDVESDLSGIDEKRFKEKNKGFWKPGDRYYEVHFQVKVLIGAADLRFELCESFSPARARVELTAATQGSTTRSSVKTTRSRLNGRLRQRHPRPCSKLRHLP